MIKSPHNTLIICFLSLLSSIYSCNNITSKSEDSIASSFHAIIVKDIDLSIDWYSKALSYSLVDSTHTRSRGLKQANLANQTGRLELIEMESINNSIDSCESNLNLEPGFFKIGYTTKNLDSLLQRLDRSGVAVKGNIVTDPISLERMIVIKDPDGNRIQIFESSSNSN